MANLFLNGKTSTNKFQTGGSFNINELGKNIIPDPLNKNKLINNTSSKRDLTISDLGGKGTNFKISLGRQYNPSKSEYDLYKEQRNRDRLKREQQLEVASRGSNNIADNIADFSTNTLSWLGNFRPATNEELQAGRPDIRRNLSESYISRLAGSAGLFNVISTTLGGEIGGHLISKSSPYVGKIFNVLKSGVKPEIKINGEIIRPSTSGVSLNGVLNSNKVPISETSHLKGKEAATVFREYKTQNAIDKNSPLYKRVKELSSEARERYGLVNNNSISDEQISDVIYDGIISMQKQTGSANITSSGQPRILYRGDTERYSSLLDRPSPTQLVNKKGTMDNSLGNLFLGDYPRWYKGSGVDNYVVTADYYNHFSKLNPNEFKIRPSQTGSGAAPIEMSDGIIKTSVVPEVLSPYDGVVERSKLIYDSNFNGKNRRRVVKKLSPSDTKSGVNDINAYFVNTKKVRDASDEIPVMEMAESEMQEFGKRWYGKRDVEPSRENTALHFETLLNKSKIENQGLLKSKGEVNGIEPRWRDEHTGYDYFAVPNWNKDQVKHIFPYDPRVKRDFSNSNIYKTIIGTLGAAGAVSTNKYKQGGSLFLKSAILTKLKTGGKLSNSGLNRNDRNYWNGFIDFIEKQDYKEKLEGNSSQFDRNVWQKYGQTVGEIRDYDKFISKIQKGLHDIKREDIDSMVNGKGILKGFTKDQLKDESFDWQSNYLSDLPEVDGHLSKDTLRKIPVTKKYIFSPVEKVIETPVEEGTRVEADKFKEGGKVNTVVSGALHARKHTVKDNEEFSDAKITNKGVPVVVKEDGGVIQTAEVEREELILHKELTEKLEALYKDGSEEAAIEAGKLLAEELTKNLKDNTDVVAKIEYDEANKGKD